MLSASVGVCRQIQIAGECVTIATIAIQFNDLSAKQLLARPRFWLAVK